MEELSDSPDAMSRHDPCFVISPLSKESLKDAARIYTYDFLADEPTSKRHAPDLSKVFLYSKMYVSYLLEKDLSFIAADVKTGEIAGFIFCFDLAGDLESKELPFAGLLSFFPDAISMIDELEGRIFDLKKIPPGDILHIFQIGVARNYRGMGISKRMINHVLLHAEKKGFRQIIADCTNPASKAAFEKCGFYEAEFYSYDDFKRNDIRFFEGLKGGISLMVRDLMDPIM
ncbi:MAG: GNAT family N-acetyltransferase [Methanomicrobiaceae archaeon]|nr:GNAT family N-acetyltransferase [Methanomicrobiaceae archaeon]